MHSQSMCDCYCRTRVPLTRQRDDIHTERSRGRGTKGTISRSSKPETSRSTKKIPLTPARVINDEQLDTKRSTVIFPVSPILSPETSAVLEDVEKLIRDAQIQMKEIGNVTSGNRLRKHMNLYPDEAPIDDENDQLLYIRERVAYKFQEANGWIDTDSTNSNSQRFPTKDCAAMQPWKVIDLSAPRFNMSEDRYKEFSRQKSLETQTFGSTASRVEDQRDNGDKLTGNGQTRPALAAVDNNRKIETCSVQMGPSVNIKAELRTQNLDDIHISPDPSFVQETQNVATYVVCHDSAKRNASPRRKKKFVKILEDSDDKNGDRKWTSKAEKGDSKNEKNIESSSNSTRKKDSEKFEMIADKPADVTVEDIKEFVAKVGPINETETAVLTIFENEKYLESTTSKNLSDYHSGDRESITGNKESNCDSRNVEQNVENANVRTDGSSVRIIHNNEQKQVRFDEQTLMVTSKCNVESIRNLEQNFKVPSRQDDLKGVPISKDNSDRFSASSVKTVQMSKDHVLPSSTAIPVKHISNKKRHEEICEKRKSEKGERYKMIDERFSCILKSYCEQKENRVKIESSNVTPSTSMNSTGDSAEDSAESDDLNHLYEPSVNELDKVLIAYSKVIDNVGRSTKAIDEFLSRPEIEQYRVENTYKIKTSEKPFASMLPIRERNSNVHRFKPEIRTKLKTRKLIVEDPSTLTNEQLNYNDKRSKLTKCTPLSKPVLVAKDHDSRKSLKKYTLSKKSDPFSTRPNFGMTDRASHWRKFSRKETTESSRDSETVEFRDEKGLRILETRSPRPEKDSSCLTTSTTCHLSSSSDTKTVDNIIISSTVKDDTADFRPTIVNNGKEDELKKAEYFHHGSLQNIIPQSTTKRGCPEANNTERLITRVLREEASFIEDKIKNIFNIDKIVGVIVESLAENLKNEKLSFKPRDLELLISENVSLSNMACGNNGIIQMKSDDDSEKQSFHIECVQSEDIFDGVETSPCNIEIIEKSDSSESVGKNLNAETTPSTISESRSIKKNSSVEKIDHGINSVDESWEENSNANDNGDNVVYSKTSDTEKGEMVTSPCSGDKQAKEFDDKNLNFQKIEASVIDQQSRNKEYKILDTLEEQNILQNTNENIILNHNDDVDRTQDPDEIPLTKKNEEAEDLLKNDPSILNEKFASSNDTILVARKETSVSSQLTDNTEKVVAPSGNNLSHASSSDSLHGCLSLRSSSRNLSKTSSNNTEFSQDVKKCTQAPEMSNLIDDGERNANSSRFEYIFDKQKILLEIYDEVHQKFWSSTLDTNYSNVLNQPIRLSDDISTISAVESNKIDILSDTSHSEGELYLPSSGSYSLGEVRMVTKGRSDGENTNDSDENLTTFVTKEMVASWKESSKSLIQSIGEI